ncbi:MAG: PAS domain S-box protein [Bacteroidetes bacterium]|nr:PAS domain S-box protein [Bacteroidota bacterium]
MNKFLFACACALACTLVTEQASGQNMATSTYGISSGLPSNHILKVFQDSHGRLWLGTMNGLAYNDGNGFHMYRQHALLSNNPVAAIIEDRNQNLWFGTTRQGLCRLTGNKISVFNTDNGLSSDNITSLATDKNGHIWIGCDEGLNKFDGNKFSTFTQTNGLPSNNILSLCYDTLKNRLLIGTSNGLVYLESGIIKKLNQELLDTVAITSFLAEKDKITFGSNGRIYRMDGNRFEIIYNEETEQSDIERKPASSIIRGNDGALWATFNGYGLIRFQAGMRKNYSTANGLPSNYALSMCNDREGNIWVATQNGLAKLRHNIFNIITTTQGLTSNKILATYKATDTSIYAISYSGGIMEVSDNATKVLLAENSIKSSPWCAMADSSKYIYIGATNGVSRFDLNTGQIDFPFAGISRNVVHAIAKDHDNDLYFATDKGVFIQQKDTLKNINFKSGLNENKTRKLFCDSKGTIWIGTMRGLYFLENRQAINFNKKLNLNTGPISGINETKDGKLLISTFDFGLYIYDLTNSSTPIQHLRNLDGLSSNHINFAMGDNENNIWLCTNMGIDKLSKKASDTEYRIESFNRSTGYEGFESNYACETNNGKIWFATDNGIMLYRKGMTATPVHEPILYIEKMDLFLMDFDWEANGFALNEQSEIPKNPNLKYDQNHVSFTFKAVYFTSPDDIQYQYQLQGLDKDWLPLTRINLAYYPNLPPGDYVFMVRATTNGRTFTEPQTVAFCIVHPWWQAAWAYAIYAGIIGGLVYMLYWWRTRSLLNAKRQLARVVQDRTRELKKSNAELEKLSLVAKETENAVLIFDEDLNLEYANQGFTHLTGFLPEEIIQLRGANIKQLTYNENIESILREAIDGQKSVVYESRIRHKEGRMVWASTTLTPIFDHNTHTELQKVVVIDTDITERKTMEDRLKENIKERDLLLREIHHRVKNNLQIIISLFNLQSYYVQDENSSKVLQDGQHRIKSMALIHEKFYQSEGLSKIDFKDYIQRLADNLSITFNALTPKPKITISGDNSALDIDTAVPCGLILNEVLSNCFNHAFNSNSINPEIQISFNQISPSKYSLEVNDNGIGLPPSFSIETSESLGMQLIQALCEQLEGKIELESANGTSFKIDFSKVN